MSLIGLHIYIAFKIKSLLPNKDYFFISLLIGLTLPEIETNIILLRNLLLSTDNIIPLFNKNFTHSFLTISIIYLFFLIAYEIKKNKLILNIGKGITYGMISNIIFDLILRFGDIDVFWPLPIGTIKSIEYQPVFYFVLLALEFILFRLAATELIKIILNNPLIENGNLINHLSYSMKFNLIFFVLFFLSFIYIPSINIKLFALFYPLSYTANIFFLLRVKNNI